MKKSYLAALAILCLLLPACTQKDERPNFLIMISDDQRWDQLSYADDPIIPELKTPNLDKLASEGVYFRNTFIPTPICAVSRACIQTGMYESTHGMNHFNTPIAPDVLEKTYPALLHENGYRTGMLGKWGMGTEGTDKIFDVFNAWYHQGPYFHETDSGRVHNSQWLADRAREFLGSNEPGVPFCLTICFKAPHHPYQPDPRDKGLFEDVDIPKRITDTPEGYEAMAHNVMDSSLNRWCYFDERRDEATKNDFEKNFLRCVVSLDRAVGEIMNSLEDMGFDDNTIVFYISDNGYQWGEHGLGGKWLLYEESIKVPMIIEGPGVSKKLTGEKLDQMVLNIDIAPTILDIAGISLPEMMDGMSLKSLIANKSDKTRDDFFMEHVGVIEVETPIPDSRGVRTEEWKYIRYINVDPEVEEMYNIKLDPIESNNVVNDEKYREVKEDLIKRYREYMDSFRE